MNSQYNLIKSWALCREIARKEIGKKTTFTLRVLTLLKGLPPPELPIDSTSGITPRTEQDFVDTIRFFFIV